MVSFAMNVLQMSRDSSLNQAAARRATRDSRARRAAETGLTRQPIAVAIADPADFGVAMRIGMIIGMEGATLNDLVKTAQRMED
jgi:hypothetical protein